MSAPDRYELFRIVTDYEALQDGFLDRIDELNTTMEQIDAAGGLTRGNTQKLLTANKGSPRKDKPNCWNRRTFGWESLGKVLKGSGLALVLVVDDERFAPIKEQLIKRKRPRTKSEAKPLSKDDVKQIISGTFANHGRIGGRLRSAMLSPSQRKKIAKAASRARWRKRHRRNAGLPAAS